MWTKTCSIEHCDKRGPRKLKVSLQISWCWNDTLLFLAKFVWTLPLVLCLHTCHRPHFGKDQPVDFDGITTTWKNVQQVSMHQKAVHKSLQDICLSPIFPSACFLMGKRQPARSSTFLCSFSKILLTQALTKGSGDKWSFMEHSLKAAALFKEESERSWQWHDSFCKQMEGWKQA